MLGGLSRVQIWNVRLNVSVDQRAGLICSRALDFYQQAPISVNFYSKFYVFSDFFRSKHFSCCFYTSSTVLSIVQNLGIAKLNGGSGSKTLSYRVESAHFIISSDSRLKPHYQYCCLIFLIQTVFHISLQCDTAA